MLYTETQKWSEAKHSHKPFTVILDELTGSTEDLSSAHLRVTKRKLDKELSATSLLRVKYYGEVTLEVI